MIKEKNTNEKFCHHCNRVLNREKDFYISKVKDTDKIKISSQCKECLRAKIKKNYYQNQHIPRKFYEHNEEKIRAYREKNRTKLIEYYRVYNKFYYHQKKKLGDLPLEERPLMPKIGKPRKDDPLKEELERSVGVPESKICRQSLSRFKQKGVVGVTPHGEFILTTQSKLDT